MTYTELEKFITNTMRMRHIYQPVMLLALLLTKGECLEEVVVWAILAHLPHNQGQIKKYKRTVRNTVGPVLTGRKIIEREGETYKLRGFSSLSKGEVNHLVNLCRQKINEYQAH